MSAKGVPPPVHAYGIPLGVAPVPPMAAVAPLPILEEGKTATAGSGGSGIVSVRFGAVVFLS